MTSHQRSLLEVQDILAIRLTCRDCGAAISIAPEKVKELHDRCPNCPKDWFGTDSTDKTSLSNVIAELTALKKRGKNTTCHIQFEVENS